MADYTLSAKVTMDASQFTSGARQVQGQLSGLTSAAGSMTKSVALGNVAAGLFSKGMGMLSSSMGQAVKRIDTMKNFPILMESLGYNADDAAKSINKISENLDGLPTSTDSIVTTVQRLAPLTNTLDEATDIALAMNNAMLAGGKDAGVQANALGQYQRMLSAGMVDMRGWRSMMNAMPGQLDQVAKSMLGQKAKAQDLYAAMKEGKISFADFNNEVVKLNKTGLPGLKNFEEQARAATGGIGTAVQNLRNRIAKGLADILEGIGRERISGFINNLSSTIKTGLSGLSDFAGKAADVVFPILEKLVANLPKIAAAITAITGIKFAWSGIQTGIATMTRLGAHVTTAAARFSDFAANIALSGKNYGRISGGLSDIAAKLGRVSPLAAGAGAALAGVVAALTVKAIAECVQNIQNLHMATDGLKAAAMGATGELKNMDNALDVSSQLAGTHTKTLQELSESGAQLAQSMMDRNTALAESNNVLGAYFDTIEEFNGKTLESEEDIATFKLAVDKLNEALGTEYTVEKGDDGRYRIMAGDAEAATEAIERLIQMKEAEARASVYQENYEDALKQQKDAADTVEYYAQKVEHLNDLKVNDPMAFLQEGGQDALDVYTDSLNKATDEYNAAGEAADKAKGMMGNAAAAASDDTSAYYKLLESLTYVSSAFADSEYSLSDFEAALNDAGITQEQFSSLSVDAQARMAAGFQGTTKSVQDTYKAVKDMDKAKDPNVNVKTNAKDAKKDVDGVTSSVKGVPSSKNVTITADTSKAVSVFEAFKSKVNSWQPKVSVGLSMGYQGGGRQAAGGIFLGNPNILGSIPRHADGGILAQPTLTSVGWVGEAGAEAIIPLSNKTYIKPFAQTVAAEMGNVGYGDVYVTLAYNADSDAKQMANDLSREIKLRRALEAF